MGNANLQGVTVRVTGPSMEIGRVGVVQSIKTEWGVKMAIVRSKGLLRSKDFTVEVSHLTRA